MASCYANPNPLFQPAMRLIAAITNSNPAIVTTTFAHQYLDGLSVRLDLPPAVGMQQANGLIGIVTVLTDTTFSVTIDTTTFEPFAIPMSLPPFIDTCAQVVPVGEVAETLRNATRNRLG